MLPSFDPLRLGPPYLLLPGARLAEELGFDTGWIGDHLAYHPPTFDALCAASAVAAVTTRLRLGTGVLLLPMRQPVWTAKQLATVASLAPDRFFLGIGVGGEGEAEFEAAGFSTAGRGRRLDESLEVVEALLRGQPVDYHGRQVAVRSPALAPVPPAHPPVIVGGRSDAALRRAARVGDGWLGVWLDLPRFRRALDTLAECAAGFGRPRPTVLFMLFVHVTDDEHAARDEVTRFVRGQYGLPFEALERWIVIGSAGRVAQQLAEFRDAGAEGFAIVTTAEDPMRQYEHLADVRALLG
ncbi:LLM class flavin-dependent oxidoreductase [Pseudonocardia sp. WMMC193]|uniref:LLM class flavin-dependent oxidoreductase n=1 Tax=Pseudonocardia sp. WMMC193 TaxID=2911965 RepID=UPI001F3F97FD|nr:LLM class flavin-dependent oxidoreductase [Pseudonocardia sp. WMMC193]MCF7550781.1 LLM class flavin-dependent oxidoreductase [Pseudonocardia sp. WMMC193]